MLAEALALAATLSYPAACIQPIEQHFRLPAGIVAAIIRVESGGNPRAINRANRNGTTDFGMMQINSFHLPRLAAHGIDEQVLLDQPCKNIAIGADILAQNLAATEGALVPALSMYNTGHRNSSVGAAYASRVLSHFGESGPLVVLSAPATPTITPERSPLFAASASGRFASRSGAFSPAQTFAAR